jgi:putative transposase
LGEIVDETMILSDFGKIVETEWYKSFEIRDELVLHEFVIMPNHLHAIVEINNGLPPTVETHGRASLPIVPDSPIVSELLSIKRNTPIRLPKSISSFMAGFKSSINTKIDDYIDEHQLILPKYNRNNHFFQPNYHDHIIRNDIEYRNISNYIINNPANWKKDKINAYDV